MVAEEGGLEHSLMIVCARCDDIGANAGTAGRYGSMSTSSSQWLIMTVVAIA